MQIVRMALQYLRNKLAPAIFYLHMLVIVLVLGQLISSNFIKISKSGEIGKNIISFYGTWAHIITGIFLALITLIFFAAVLRAHGFKNYFPYLSGNNSQLVTDIHQLKQRKLPEPKPAGLASIVQGLGLGAMLLVLVSGVAWFVFWSVGYQGANVFRDTHKQLTGLVIAYIIGHGGMGVIHIISSIKAQWRR